MSLSDYISIFDTRPIAQSHLFEAATATLCAVYTGYTSIYTTRTNALQIAAEHEQRVYSRIELHGRHATPGQARPRHATPRRFAGPHLMLPAGPADADADSDAATAAARCLSIVRTCVYGYTVVRSAMKL